MPRQPRYAPGGVLHHVFNRAAGRRELFSKTQDYAAFQQVLRDTIEATGMRLCAFCVMPNHWHLVLWPREDGELGRFKQEKVSATNGTSRTVNTWHLLILQVFFWPFCGEP